MGRPEVNRRNLLKGIAVTGVVGSGVAAGRSPDDNDYDYEGTDIDLEEADEDLAVYNVGTQSEDGAELAEDEALDVIDRLELGDQGVVIIAVYEDDVADDLEDDAEIRYVEEDEEIPLPEPVEREAREDEEVVSDAEVIEDVEDEDAGVEVQEEEEVQAERDEVGDHYPYGLGNINADVAHAEGIRGEGVDIAILDSGIDSMHSDVAPNLGDGISFIGCNVDDCNEEWDDEQYHGTHVAGIAAAAETGDGVIGVAPDATLHAVKLGVDSFSHSNIARGLTWVADQEYDVANLSLGSERSSPSIVQDAVEYAHSEGVLIIASAGNDGRCTNCVVQPAGLDEAIAVGSSNWFDGFAFHSSQGPEMETVAPGKLVRSAWSSNGTLGGLFRVMWLTGTSMAAPHVSGVAALLMAQGLSNEEARARIQEAAADVGLDENRQGYGRVDATAALQQPAIETREPSDVTADEATLEAEITYSGRVDSFDIYFEYRDADTTEWTSTAETTAVDDDTITYQLEDLDAETTYEYRAVAETDTGTTEGATVSFATDSGDDDGDGDLERIRPVDPEVTVQPDTTLMFEVEAVDDSERQTTEWEVDDTGQGGLSMGPWHSAYFDHQNADYWHRTVESDKEVTAVVEADDTTHDTTWEVTTASDGIEEPTITDASPDPDDRHDLDEDTIEFELEVNDPNGELDQVVWWAQAVDFVLDVTSVTGSEDTASIEPDTDQLVPEGVVAWVVNEHGAVVESDAWLFEFPSNDPAFEISDVVTNSPIGPEETLETTATIENVGDDTGSTEVEFIVGHDPETVDTADVDLESGETEEITLSFDAGDPAGGREEFPGIIEAGEATHEVSIVVDEEEVSPAAFNVISLATNSPVGPGETLEVETIIENGGDGTGTTDIELIVGHDPSVEDSEMLTLDPGETEELALAFEAGDPTGGEEQFPVEVDTGADADSTEVVVEEATPATFEVESITTNSPVGAGETLEVTSTIHNIGDETGTTDIELIVGHDPTVEDSEMLTLNPGEASEVTLTFQAGDPAGEEETFPVEVDTGADSDSEMITVN